MKVGIKEFYTEITGKPEAYGNLVAARALTRWGIATTNVGKGARQFLVVDVADLARAKAAYKAEHAKPKTNGKHPVGKGLDSPKSIHYKLGVISSQLAAVEKLLNEFKEREARILTTKE